MSPFTRKQRICRPFQGSTFYKPRAVPLSKLEVIKLELDELEAIHLCDFEGLNQSEAAEKMNVSSSTLQRLLYSGRKKVADVLYAGKALEITTPDNVSIVETEINNICNLGNKKRKGKCWSNKV